MNETAHNNQATEDLEDRALLVWRQMLGSPDATLDDNFFECGGTSLAAARLASRLTTELECRVSAADILAYPSVRRLSARLSGKDTVLDRNLSNHRAAQQRNAFAMRQTERVPRSSLRSKS